MPYASRGRGRRRSPASGSIHRHPFRDVSVRCTRIASTPAITAPRLKTEVERQPPASRGPRPVVGGDRRHWCKLHLPRCRGKNGIGHWHGMCRATVRADGYGTGCGRPHEGAPFEGGLDGADGADGSFGNRIRTVSLCTRARAQVSVAPAVVRPLIVG